MTPHAPDPEVGLCSVCRHARTSTNRRGSTFWRCAAAHTDERLKRYPPLPVNTCPAHEPPGAPTHGGGIAVRESGGEPEFLLVRASAPPHPWVFPKGHIEPGETLEECALREAREEAGVETELGARIGGNEFDSAAGPVRVEYYLLHFVREVPPEEERERCWCPYAEARARLDIEDLREFLARAQALLTRLGGPRMPG